VRLVTSRLDRLPELIRHWRNCRDASQDRDTDLGSLDDLGSLPKREGSLDPVTRSSGGRGDGAKPSAGNGAGRSYAPLGSGGRAR
jgi:hypothetical protein